ncbi:hypothetical protein KP509_23G022700 [Ceratopteris richardii]|uniref:Uncharacterized protein n=1 Tax=Ceratopteris richardii TaxID=49495 RepID=A0A8T2RZU0_CERRI|nr:hypothetical protein KP509_23G022700 [Ceratopteris richardii]
MYLCRAACCNPILLNNQLRSSRRGGNARLSLQRKPSLKVAEKGASSASSPSQTSSLSPPPSSPFSDQQSQSPSLTHSAQQISSPAAMAKLLDVSDEQEAALAHLLASKGLMDFIARVPSWADAQKESGMPQRQQRAFYSHDDWLQHRSSLRHLRHLLSSGSSRVILSLIPPVFTVTAISVVIAGYNTAVNLSLLPSFFPLLHAASLPYELTAPAIALLLVFRTDASYSRYDEARKTWNKVLSTTENFVRLSLQVIEDPQDLGLLSSLIGYIMAFPVSLKCHLVYCSDERKDLQSFLSEEDLDFILSANHRPHRLIQLMSQTLSLINLDHERKVYLDENISRFITSLNVCERIIRTPIPLSYTRLTSRFLVLWHLTLPIILWDSCKWLVVPATFFNAASLFCIEEVGVIIEEPFPMLALDKMIGLLHDNVRDMLKFHHKTKHHIVRKRRLKNENAYVASLWSH